MPGIVGFTCKNLNSIQDKSRILRQMQDIVTHRKFNIKDDHFFNVNVCCTRTHANILQRSPQPYNDDNVFIWFDGEIYNQNELREDDSNQNLCDLSLFASLYKQKEKNDFTFLKKIDGIYAAVIYDTKKQCVHLISDRYGFCHLYWMIKNNNFVWSSEVKGMIVWPTFDFRINRQSVDDFFNKKHLFGSETWFKDVNLIPPATVLTWDIEKALLHEQSYWSWSDILPMSGKIYEPEIAKELGRLFVDAVEVRCEQTDSIGVCLSGGLDSRAILAAMPNQKEPIQTVTFGKRACDDIKIASIATKIKGGKHQVVMLNSKNWLIPRFEGVWLTDGQLDIMNMHMHSTYQMLRDCFMVNLSGFLGDAVLGGFYIREGWNVIDKITNTGRRFTCEGIRLGKSFIVNRKPFFDNKLIEFAMSIPDQLKCNSYIYNKMLLMTFPDFFESLPWQTTGMPISGPKSVSKSTRYFQRVKNKFFRELDKLDIVRFGNPYYYSDYPYWIRKEPARSIFKRILTNPRAIYPEYTGQEEAVVKFGRHLNGEDHSAKLCQYVTFEIWLQQIFENRYRPIDGLVEL